MTTHLPSKNKRVFFFAALGVVLVLGGTWKLWDSHTSSSGTTVSTPPQNASLVHPMSPDETSAGQDPHHAGTATSAAVAHPNVPSMVEGSSPSAIADHQAADSKSDSKHEKASAETMANTGSVASAPAAVAPDTCFVATYQRDKESKAFVDNEEWAQQRNLVHLAKNEVNKDSVCVRVNGTAVKHEWTAKGVVFGPVAGPGAKITVRYCMGKEQCKEECKIPKDDFMAALGTEDDSDSKGDAKAKPKSKAGRWAASEGGADVGTTVEAEMAKELADQADLVVFDGWSGKGEHPACTRRVASVSK